MLSPIIHVKTLTVLVFYLLPMNIDTITIVTKPSFMGFMVVNLYNPVYVAHVIVAVARFFSSFLVEIHVDDSFRPERHDGPFLGKKNNYYIILEILVNLQYMYFFFGGDRFIVKHDDHEVVLWRQVHS